MHSNEPMSPLEVWVYRDNKQLAHGGSVLRALERSMAQVTRLRTQVARRRAALEALVVAGELETALADALDPLERVVGDASRALAMVILGKPVDLAACAEGLAHARAPRSLAIRPHAGFAYDALHPEAYAAASHVVDARDVLVIGVGAAGRTLACITSAALEARGATTERIAVRRGDASDELDGSLRRAGQRQAAVVLVDEGPTVSGATLLDTAEAVVRAGIPQGRVYVIVGRSVDPGRLRAPDAASRFRRLRTTVAPSSMFAPVRPGTSAGTRDVSSGAWRHLHFTRAEDWPAVVESTERRKLLSGGRLFKFEGLGSNGLAARHRASALAAEGIALDPSDEGDGWTSYTWTGKPLTLADLDADLVEHIARYCARRPTLCPLVSAESDLDSVVAANLAAILGDVASPPALEVVRIATTDGRLAPHEWIRLEDGSVMKTDATAHGDDRFFPGPTDIAWDLAGAIVEWEMNPEVRDYFLRAYRRASGDDAAPRIDAWLVAYLAIQTALAVHAVEIASAAEAPRLRLELERYRARLHQAAISCSSRSTSGRR